MGKTFRRNEGRHPKWDKGGNKSRKQREYEEDEFKYRSPKILEPIPPDLSENTLPDDNSI